jgi:ferric-dicitrate binding protein FerR (iron transport regulator)
MDPGRFEPLLERYQSGDATPDEVTELEGFLRADPDKRRRLVECFLLEVQLRKVGSSILPVTEKPQTPRGRFRRVVVWVTATAAAVALTVGAVLWFASGRKQLPASEVLAGRVSVGGGTVERVPAGAWFEVAGDTAAVIRLADGSRAELEPASEAALHGRVGEVREVVELSRGGGAFQVAHGGGLFRVETPAGTVTALGTAFSVRLQPRRELKTGTKRKPALAVAVTEGSVRVDADGQSVVIAAGQGRVFGDDGDQNNRNDGDRNNKNDGDRKDRQKKDGGRGNQPDGQNGQQNNGDRNKEGNG